MLRRANLGGVQGVADLHPRYLNPIDREWRGAFVFRLDDEATIARLSEGGSIVFEALIDDEPRRLDARITAFTNSGLAFFEAVEHVSPQTQ